MYDQPIEWRPIAGYEGIYEVSSDGQVASLPRHGRRTRRVLRPHLAEGYRQVGLHRDGVARQFHVHRLVAIAFLGTPAIGQEACHGNGDRLDNRVSNLRWGSRSENALDRVAHGRDVNASKASCPQGHPYDESNTAHSNGYRRCKECNRVRSRAVRRSLREAA